jgi:hypothetical protein
MIKHNKTYLRDIIVYFHHTNNLITTHGVVICDVENTPSNFSEENNIDSLYHTNNSRFGNRMCL